MQTLTGIYDQKLKAGTLAPDPDQQHAVAVLERLRLALAAHTPAGWWPFARKFEAPKGLYLHGGVGRGKSMLMDLFFETAPVDKKRRVHFHAFMLEVHDFMHERRAHRTARDRIDGDLIAAADKIAKDARLLCFDEFQVRDVADAMIIGRLFTALFARGVTVVMTSNIPPDELYAGGLQRELFLPFIELLKQNLTVFSFTGDTDYRMRKLRELQVYFWPYDSDAHVELDKIFKTISDGLEGAPLDIPVKGRIIHVPRAAKTVAAFTFAELCEQPKSALDYLELVKRFKVFVVEKIPRLDDMKRDAVTRFITLIDTLYDNHAMIAISAAAAPDKIYTGTDLAQVFERTVSRLMEMQSRAYRDS